MRRISCGLFGLAPNMEQDLTGTMKSLKGFGFSAVEPLVALPGDPALKMLDQLPPFLKALLWTPEKIAGLLPVLNEIGLKISSGHIGFAPGTRPVDMVDNILQEAELTGIRHFMTSMTFDSEEKALYCAEQLSEVNRVLNPRGVTLGYHNHEMEFQRLPDDSGETLMDRFLAASDDCVKLQLDTGWQMYAGDDVQPFMEKYARRIQSVHLKDFAPDYKEKRRDEAFAATGFGVLLVREILARLPAIDLIDCGLMIDQDGATLGCFLMEDLEKGMAFLRSTEDAV